MKLSATEKRIYALAQKWAKAQGRAGFRWGKYYSTYSRADARKQCGRALLKLFKERA